MLSVLEYTRTTKLAHRMLCRESTRDTVPTMYEPNTCRLNRRLGEYFGELYHRPAIRTPANATG